MSELLVHIGYHKTATSWLQRHLFENATLGLTRTHSRYELKHPVVGPHDYDFDSAECRAYFQPAIERARASGLLPVVSHERLSGEIHIGARDSKGIADRLAATFPEAHVLIVIREQRTMLRSIYGQFIKGTGVWRLRDYLTPPVVEKKHFKYALFRLDHFRYDRPIAYYQRLFGRENVTVLPFELFRENPKQFVRRILDDAAVPVTPNALNTLPFAREVNPSLSAIGIEIKRIFNRVAGQRTPFNTTPLLPLGDPDKRLQKLAFRIDRTLPAAWRQAANRRMAAQIERTVGDFYAESNRRTAELTGLDLKNYGYQLPSGRQRAAPSSV